MASGHLRQIRTVHLGGDPQTPDVGASAPTPPSRPMWRVNGGRKIVANGGGTA